MSTSPPTAVLRLSPSRIATFLSCPRRYRYRYVDGLDEPASPAMARGTLVHLVCERLLERDPAERTLEAALALLPECLDALQPRVPELADLWADPAAVAAFCDESAELLRAWLALEDVAALDVVGREQHLEADLGTFALSGIVDRVDRLPDGSVAVVDYKTGRAPAAGWERRPFLQLRCYALLLSLAAGERAAALRLVHLAAGGEVLELPASPHQLAATERQVRAIAVAVQRATDTDDWPTRPGSACSWCAFADRCPDAPA